MKTIKIISIMLCCVLLFHFAQAQLENRFSIGPRIGVNFASTNQDVNSLTGLVAGITSTYSINEASGITVDALYSQRGFSSQNLDTKLTYFSLPILYDVFFGRLGESFRPKFYAGFAPGFLLDAERQNNDISSQYKSSTFDFVGGGGFNYRLANRVWLNADLRALLGMSDLTEGATDVKNRTVQVSLGIAYGL